MLAHLLLIISVVLWGTISTIIAILLPTSALTWAGSRWLDFTCFIYGIRFEVDRSESQFDPTQPTLVVSNHQSIWDIPAAVRAFPNANIRMVAKKELFQIPFFGTVMRFGDFIPIDRGNQTSSKAATRSIAERFSRGIHVWVAPEGTRSTGAELGPFKKGSFAVAIEAQIPVQPLVVLDSYLAQPKVSLMPRPGTVVHVKILPSTPTKGLVMSDRGQLSEQIHAQMKATLVSAAPATKAD